MLIVGYGLAISRGHYFSVRPSHSHLSLGMG